MEDLAFANQSTTIYLTYSLIQILVHRSFLPPSLARLRALGDGPSAGSTSAHTMTSLAIAVNAAKAGTRFLHVLRVRGRLVVVGTGDSVDAVGGPLGEVCHPEHA